MNWTLALIMLVCGAVIIYWLIKQSQKELKEMEGRKYKKTKEQKILKRQIQ